MLDTVSQQALLAMPLAQEGDFAQKGDCQSPREQRSENPPEPF
jgi:hypothetical protein